jgi:DNA-binding transcriptional LysR family regulator
MTAELRHLRHFLVVAEEGHVSRAARRLHVAQPALSRSLRQLEAAVGTALLHRHARGVDLTAAGEALLPKARAAVAAADDALEPLDTTESAQDGVVRLGFLAPIPDAAAQFAESFQAVHPKVSLEWQPLDFVSQMESVRDGTVDAAFLWVPHADPDIAFQPFASEARAVLISARNPLAARTELTFADIMDEPHPGYPAGAPQHWADFWYLTDVRGRRPRLVADAPLTVEDAWALVASGHAITVAPASLARNYARAGVAARLLVDVAPAVLAVAWRRGEASAATEAFVRFARRGAWRQTIVR